MFTFAAATAVPGQQKDQEGVKNAELHPLQKQKDIKFLFRRPAVVQSEKKFHHFLNKVSQGYKLD